jgi:hypothetical protein
MFIALLSCCISIVILGIVFTGPYAARQISVVFLLFLFDF